MDTISRDEVKGLIDAGEKVAIIDTLPRAEYEEGHIPGALSMPLQELRKLAPKILRDKDQQIITYCGSSDCPLSTRAAEELEALGYMNVTEYIGGKADWEAGGYDLEEGEQDLDVDFDDEDDDEEEDSLESLAARYREDEAEDGDEADDR
ncbi:MAG: rhodanese-like domain-containing protein [Alphaproteobacteria bacterium]